MTTNRCSHREEQQITKLDREFYISCRGAREIGPEDEGGEYERNKIGSNYPVHTSDDPRR